MTTKFKQTTHIFLNLLWSGWWLFGLGIWLTFLLRWWPGDRSALVRMMSSLAPWFLLILGPGVVLALWGRRYRLLTLLGLPTLFISLSYAPLFMPSVSPALAATDPIKVMSYNVWRRNNDVDSMAAVIQAEQPDILLLQELRPQRVDPLLTALKSLYGGDEWYFTYEPAIDQGIISRYPITPVEVALAKGRLQKVLVETPAGTLNVWNAHPHAFPWRKHYPEIKKLVKDIAAVDGPLIVGGDFNTNEQLETYQLINEHLYNAHWQAGWGFGFTFPNELNARGLRKRTKGLIGDTPVMRIDHIFYNDHFFARAAATLPDSGNSDHSPVTATLIPVE